MELEGLEGERIVMQGLRLIGLVVVGVAVVGVVVYGGLRGDLPMDADVINIANTIYGENGGEDYDTMVMTGSSLLNRVEAGKPEEFGADIDEAMGKGYYAVSQNSPMFTQAVTGNFPDEKSELAYKQALQIAYGLKTGKIKRHPAQFFFKKGEAKSLRKKLKSTGKVGKYETYSY